MAGNKIQDDDWKPGIVKAKRSETENAKGDLLYMESHLHAVISYR